MRSRAWTMRDVSTSSRSCVRNCTQESTRTSSVLTLLAFLNSLVIEHRLLPSISGITLGHYRVEALPVPDWPESDPRHRQIVESVASIVASDKRFRKELRGNGLESYPSGDVQAQKCR